MIGWDDIFFYCSELIFWRVNVKNIFTRGSISQRHFNMYLVLIQVAGNFFALLSYSVVDALAVNTNWNRDPTVQVQIQLSSDILERFRRQLIEFISIDANDNREWLLIKWYYNLKEPWLTMNSNMVYYFSNRILYYLLYTYLSIL